ncbi:MAG: AraC family transcriptional regulator [Bacteroidota bacterium]|jgi:AraC-like DNA-binding protein|nr:AraC family transcriptional regulator [Bacteroidota bacterium]
MIEELKIEENHQGFILLYESKTHKVCMRNPHRHKELELNIVIRGCAEYVLANQRYMLSPGSLVWLFPGQEHMLSRTDANFEMYVIVFKEELFKNKNLRHDKYNILSEPNPKGSFCKKISMPSIRRLKRVCESLCELNTKLDVIAPAYFYSGQAFGFKQNSKYLHTDPVILNAGLSYLLTISWHLFITEGSEDKKEVLNPLVEKAIHLLKNNPERDFGLMDLSYECGISSSRLSRLFNEQLGLSIVDYKNRLKLEQLISYINSNPEYSISEACYMVGFGSYSQFYKTFRQSYGISPKAYFSLEN